MFLDRLGVICPANMIQQLFAVLKYHEKWNIFNFVNTTFQWIKKALLHNDGTSIEDSLFSSTEKHNTFQEDSQLTLSVPTNSFKAKYNTIRPESPANNGINHNSLQSNTNDHPSSKPLVSFGAMFERTINAPNSATHVKLDYKELHNIMSKIGNLHKSLGIFQRMVPYIITAMLDVLGKFIFKIINEKQ